MAVLNVGQLALLGLLEIQTSKFMKYDELQKNLNVDMKNETLKLNFEKKIEEYFNRNLENLLIYLKNWEFVAAEGR